MAQTLNMTEIVRKLKSVNRFLNNVEIKGRDNMDILLGSMQAIDQVIVALENGMTELNAIQPEVKVEMVSEQK